MGFGSNGSWWKKKLAEWAPDAWFYLNDAPTDGIQVLIEDIMLARFRTANSKGDLRKIWSNYPADIFERFPDATEVVALFDENRSMVPKAKRPEQKNRLRKSQGLTEQELKELGNAKYLCHSDSYKEEIFQRVFGAPQHLGPNDPEPPTPFRQFMAKYPHTPSLKQDFLTFLSRCMTNPPVESRLYFTPGKTLTIDRALIDGEKVGVVIEHDGYTNVFEGNGGDGSSYIPGEGDLKLSAHLRKYKGKGIWIRMADMDVLPIVLMAMKDMIDKETGEIEGKIFVDLTPLALKSDSYDRQKKYDRQVVDMVALWKAIYLKMKRSFSIQSQPVETLCAFMILCGTDFVVKPPCLGMPTLWGAFEKGGHVLLSQCFHADNTVCETDWQSKRIERWMTIDEEAILQFYRYAYTYFKDKKSLSSVQQIVGTHEEARKDLLQKSMSFQDIAKRYAPKKKRKRLDSDGKEVPPPQRKRQPRIPLTEEKARAEVRRLTWNSYYWFAGHAHSPPDPVRLHPREGSAMFGWKEDPESGEVVAADVVCSSKELEEALGSPNPPPRKRIRITSPRRSPPPQPLHRNEGKVGPTSWKAVKHLVCAECYTEFKSQGGYPECPRCGHPEDGW